jgi:hypothetical protein
MGELIYIADALKTSQEKDCAAGAARKAEKVQKQREQNLETHRYTRKQKPFFSSLDKSKSDGDKSSLVCGVLGAVMVAGVAVASYMSGDPGLHKAALITSVAVAGIAGFITLGINKAKEKAAKALLEEYDRKIEKENKYLENDPEKSDVAKERLLDRIDDHVEWGNFYQEQLDKAKKLKAVGYAAGVTCAANLLYVAYNVGNMVAEGGDASVVAFGVATGIISFSGKLLFAVSGKKSGEKMLAKGLAKYHKSQLRTYEKDRVQNVIQAQQQKSKESPFKELEDAVIHDWLITRQVAATIPACERVM